jgi:hypothetical protein
MKTINLFLSILLLLSSCIPNFENATKEKKNIAIDVDKFFLEIEEKNTNEVLIKNTKTYKKFISDTSISFQITFRDDLNGIKHNTDSSYYIFEDNTLHVTRIFEAKGVCLDLLPIYKIETDGIFLYTPEVVEIDPYKYENDEPILATWCDLAGHVEIKITLKNISAQYLSKSIFLNDKLLKP